MDRPPSSFDANPCLMNFRRSAGAACWAQMRRERRLRPAENLQIVGSESRDLDVEIIVDKTEFFLQRHESLMLAQQPPQNIAQLKHDSPRQIGIEANQRRNVFSVLNRKCGLIWLGNASMRALSSNCWWRSRFISMRVLFQIFRGTATAITVARRRKHEPPIPFRIDLEQPFRIRRMPQRDAREFETNTSRSGSNSHGHICLPCEPQKVARNIQKCERPRFQRSSLFGIACRIKPPRNPAVAAAGMASHSRCQKSGNGDDRAAQIGPTTRPPSSPIKKAPSRSNRQTDREATHEAQHDADESGGVMNSISFNFWSGSRSSVKTRGEDVPAGEQRRKEAATPTLSSSVKSKSRGLIGVSIIQYRTCSFNRPVSNVQLRARRVCQQTGAGVRCGGMQDAASIVASKVTLANTLRDVKRS